jgi:hypothetical protein
MAPVPSQSLRIKIWISVHGQPETSGPYKMLDIVQRDSAYAVGDATHYGEVVSILPSIRPFTDDVDQSVVVKFDPTSVGRWCEESVFEKPPSSYDKIQIFPITVDAVGWRGDPLLTGPYSILPAENLTIENVSHLITAKTFSLWKMDCNISKDTADALEDVDFAIVHRYSSPVERDTELDQRSTELVDFASSCLSLIRPTRRSRAMHIPGVIRRDGTLDPQGFSAREDLADVPEIQKLFVTRKEDIDLLASVLPEFMQLYQKDEDGKLKDEYEPIRMAVQLYGEGYSLSYWKARHILWWSAIEALYGDGEDTTPARIYAFFGDKKLVDGYNCIIYEKGDIPSCYYPSSECLHTLGEMVPIIYDVRNFSAHGQKVPDSHFRSMSHPFGQDAIGLDVLAEAATFIIRKTVIEIVRRGWREEFKDRAARENFWLMKFALPKGQCKKRMKELKDSLARNP